MFNNLCLLSVGLEPVKLETMERTTKDLCRVFRFTDKCHSSAVAVNEAAVQAGGWDAAFYLAQDAYIMSNYPETRAAFEQMLSVAHLPRYFYFRNPPGRSNPDHVAHWGLTKPLFDILKYAAPFYFNHFYCDTAMYHVCNEAGVARQIDLVIGHDKVRIVKNNANPVAYTKDGDKLFNVTMEDYAKMPESYLHSRIVDGNAIIHVDNYRARSQAYNRIIAKEIDFLKRQAAKFGELHTDA